ncbi:acyl-CoA thioesterase (plasmid) [Streptomyces sp. BI20]|uniref:acyl-CoA thioesterase n=1 Tax=Streptomyces sp. BI20 TaxID=3403460 RepID=UPI003C78AA20
MGFFTYACALRWADMDAYGHVNNVQYARIAEEGRIRMLAGIFRPKGESAGGRHFVVAEQRIAFHRPLDYRAEPISVHVWVSALRGVSFDVECLVCDGFLVHASCRTKVVSCDLDNAGIRALTAAERARLSMFRDPPTGEFRPKPAPPGGHCPTR